MSLVPTIVTASDKKNFQQQGTQIREKYIVLAHVDREARAPDMPSRRLSFCSSVGIGNDRQQEKEQAFYYQNELFYLLQLKLNSPQLIH